MPWVKTCPNNLVPRVPYCVNLGWPFLVAIGCSLGQRPATMSMSSMFDGRYAVPFSSNPWMVLAKSAACLPSLVSNQVSPDCCAWRFAILSWLVWPLQTQRSHANHVGCTHHGYTTLMSFIMSTDEQRESSIVKQIAHQCQTHSIRGILRISHDCKALGFSVDSRKRSGVGDGSTKGLAFEDSAWLVGMIYT